MRAIDCQRLLEAAAPGSATTTDRNPVTHQERARLTLAGRLATVKYAYLYPEAANSVTLFLYPADTLTQARQLFSSPERVAGLLGLRSRGWHLRPNFHFGFMEKGLCWTTSTIDIELYVQYWTYDPDRLRAIKRSEWDEWLSRLIAGGVFAAEDESQFDSDFRLTRRQEAVPRPGIAMSRNWTASEATTSGFGRTLREAINEALDALREPRVTESGFEPASAATKEAPSATQKPQSAPAPAPTVLPPSEWVQRERIPERVRHEVWRRDQGRCVDCGSRERLEYDHIIPISRGGSNTARNIELRCETCNRRKGAHI